MRRNYLNALKYDYLPLTYWKNWFSNITQFFRNIKYAYQRVVKGYCDRDVWNLDSYYSQLFASTLRALADTTHGFPGHWSIEGKTFEDWQKYLCEMAEHFQNTLEWDLELPMNKEVEKAFDTMSMYVSSVEFEPTKDGLSKMVEHYSNKDLYEEAREVWLDTERRAYEFRESEKNLACDMLKKEFFNLWD